MLHLLKSHRLWRYTKEDFKMIGHNQYRSLDNHFLMTIMDTHGIITIFDFKNFNRYYLHYSELNFSVKESSEISLSRSIDLLNNLFIHKTLICTDLHRTWYKKNCFIIGKKYWDDELRTSESYIIVK